MDRNLYQIDDVLLRSGVLTVVLVLAGAGCLLGMGVVQESPEVIRDYGPLLLLAVLCPVGLLSAGFKVRARERRVGAVWNHLRQSVELSVPDLLANSDFDREDLEHAIRFLNNRGLGHYVWKGDVIQDARLRSLQLHIETCEACGAEVSIQVPVGFREVPSCPYCKAPAAAASLAKRRQEALESLRAEARPEPEHRSAPGRSGVPFSVPLFLVLLVAFWPAGVGYAWFKWQKAS